MRMIRTIGVAGAMAFAVAVPLVSHAGAAPTNAKSATLIQITCGSQVFNTVSNGGQNTQKQTFTPAHSLDGQSILIPSAVFDVHGVVTDENHNVVSQFDDPGGTKGNAVNAQPGLQLCSFTSTQTFTSDGSDPNGLPAGTYTVTVTGGAIGKITSNK